MTDHGTYGNENRSFLKGLYRSEKPQIMMKLVADQNLPSKIDLREKFKIEIFDQGMTSSCTANALASAYSIMSCQKNKNCPIYLSRLFIYYNERKMINQENVDQGAYIHHGVKSMQQGACLEYLFPFDTNKLFISPDDQCYKEALKHTATSIEISSDYVNQFKISLSKNIPIVCGILVYESFKSKQVGQTGIVPMPNKNEKLLGGHAICIIAFDQETKLFTFQNSWSSSWGSNGFGQISYDYINNPDLTADCHIITETEIDKSPHPMPYNPIPYHPPPIPSPYMCQYPHYLPCPLHHNPYNPYFHNLPK